MVRIKHQINKKHFYKKMLKNEAYYRKTVCGEVTIDGLWKSRRKFFLIFLNVFYGKINRKKFEGFFIVHATFSEENNRSFFRDLSIYIKITHKFAKKTHCSIFGTKLKYILFNIKNNMLIKWFCFNKLLFFNKILVIYLWKFW